MLTVKHVTVDREHIYPALSVLRDFRETSTEGNRIQLEYPRHVFTTSLYGGTVYVMNEAGKTVDHFDVDSRPPQAKTLSGAMTLSR